MSLPLPKIDFDINDREYDWFKRHAFWESLRTWFFQRGYTIYRLNYEWNGEPVCDASSCSPQHTFKGEVCHPYAFSGGDREGAFNPPLFAYLNGRVVYAQDQRKRHVVIKLVEGESQEYKILRFLSKQPSLYSLDSFPCVLPPVDFLPFDGHWFVVMPRWGEEILSPGFSIVSEVLDHIHCLLKGLAFMHKNLIAQHDISPGNMLINHFARPFEFNENTMRRKLRQERRLVYAWFDFDHAVMFSSSTPPEKRRLPWYNVGGGSLYTPKDVAQGELDYDPFSCDVASLGIWLCLEFQHLTTHIPMLAPVFDRMVDFNPKTRYTAMQVLQLFNELYSSSIPPEYLDQTIPPAPEFYDQKYPEEYDRWAGLPPAFITAWSKCRLDPTLSWSTRTLLYICGYRWGFRLVHGIRRAFRVLTWTSSFL